jgi:hypothetical protein
MFFTFNLKQLLSRHRFLCFDHLQEVHEQATANDPVFESAECADPTILAFLVAGNIKFVVKLSINDI